MIRIMKGLYSVFDGNFLYVIMVTAHRQILNRTYEPSFCTTACHKTYLKGNIGMVKHLSSRVLNLLQKNLGFDHANFHCQKGYGVLSKIFSVHICVVVINNRARTKNCSDNQFSSLCCSQTIYQNHKFSRPLNLYFSVSC